MDKGNFDKHVYKKIQHFSRTIKAGILKDITKNNIYYSKLVKPKYD